MKITLGYLAAFFVEALVIKQYCSTLFISKYSKFIEWIFIGVLYFILFGISLIENFSLNILSFLFINFVLISTLYDVDRQSSLFHATISTIIMGFSELVVVGVVSHIAKDLYESETYFQSLLILLIFSKQLYFWIMFIISRFFVKSKQQFQNSSKELLTLTVIPLISVWILITFLSVCYNVTLPEQLNSMIAISAVLLLIANLIVWGFYLYACEKNREFTEMQLQLQKEYDFVEYYKMLLSQHENHNILIHDIKKHLNSIALLNEQQEPEKIASYINELIHSSNLQSSARVCDNEFLNVIVSRYIRRCEELHISFLTDIRSQTVDFMAENDLTSLFCNLLDNAVEAASKQEDSSIKLTITRKSPVSPVVINMTNSCRKNPFFGKYGRLLSTKPNSARHGFGLKSIQRIVDKYGGNLELYYDEEEKCFHTIIRLKNPLTAK